MQKDITALIPVKGQSERVKSKNLRPFHNTNLYELKLNQLKRVDGFAKVIVSSENERILEIAKKYGFDIHIRDPRYSTSDVPMSEVYSYIASEITGEHIAWINVTNPLVDSKIYQEALRVYNNLGNEYDCLISVNKVQEYLYYHEKPVNFKPYPWPRSQDLEGVCAINFAISILPREDLARKGTLVGDKPYFFYINSLDATDIDFPENFDFCEMIYKQRQ